MSEHMRRRTDGRHIDQGSMAGFNGLTFGSTGGSELGNSAVVALHLGYDDSADPATSSYDGRAGSQLAALQREVALLRRQNRALVAANDSRQQAAVSVLAELMRDQQQCESPAEDKQNARQQLTRLVLALLDADGQQTPLLSADDPGPGEPEVPAVSPVVSSAKTRIAADEPCDDWDPLALAEVSSRGHIAPAQAATDKYATESLRAIGTRPAQYHQASLGDDHRPDEKFGPLAQSLVSADESGFEVDPESRFVLYSSSAGVFQARTLDGLRSGHMLLADIVEASARGVSLEQLEAERQGDAPHAGRGGCFWLDCTDATPAEMASLARVFGIHPLTVEDIASDEDPRDKCESFAGYHLLIYRAIADDAAHSVYEFNRGADGLATAAFAVVLKPQCVLTFHRARLAHTADVVNRLCAQPPAAVTAAYIAYAIVDDITDALIPEMRAIELEVDAVDELVLILSTNEQADMLRRIGAARRTILTLWRLLQGKPDVIRAFSKIMERQAALAGDDLACLRGLDPMEEPARASSSAAPSLAGPRRREQPLWQSRFNGREKSLAPQSARPSTVDLVAAGRDAESQVSADEVAHYLSDVYDHIAALLASSSHCDMVLSRAHSNYLARISLELGESTVETNLFASRWTVIGAILVPLNVVTGLWGMNVKVPGGDRQDLRDFFLILSGCLTFVIAVIVWARYKKIF
ncbi:CorA metal ion transporter [Coemansia spiralis]|uniref:CorA metal ion transporter n=1 Tax=Coemansia spiralis TaxID=417178 RepID=A0A9W8GF76_9FUNG|nr:CorA metal ion transporter [Coemansia spiralis]